MKLRGTLIAVLSLWLLFAPAAHAADPSGLSISPIRRDLTVDAGQPNSSSITIGNLTDSSMTVNLSVKQFSVSDNTYDYTFEQPTDDWIKLDDKQITLKPGDDKQILYDVETPAKAPPGGYYFTLLASANIQSGGALTTIQATSLLYLTVNGNLVRTSVLKNSSAPLFVTGPNIPYKFDVLDTGNVHFNAHFFGQVESIFGTMPQTGTDSTVLPDKPRTISNSVASPFWPGIYRVTYGYKVDFADITTTQSSYILYFPPWSMAVAGAIVLLIIWSVQVAKSKKESYDD